VVRQALRQPQVVAVAAVQALPVVIVSGAVAVAVAELPQTQKKQAVNLFTAAVVAVAVLIPERVRQAVLLYVVEQVRQVLHLAVQRQPVRNLVAVAVVRRMRTLVPVVTERLS